MEPKTKRIKLRDRFNNVRAVALVDVTDWDKVKAYTYHLAEGAGSRYAKRSVDYSVAVPMHWDVVGLDKRSPGMVIDHINGNGLDNRRANLEVITHAENVRRGIYRRQK